MKLRLHAAQYELVNSGHIVRLAGRCDFTLWACSEKPFTLLMTTGEDEDIAIFHGHMADVSFDAAGFSRAIFKGDAPIGIRLYIDGRLYDAPDHGPVPEDDDGTHFNSLPAPAPAPNWLSRLRATAQQRSAGYELADDDDELFEEERLQQASAVLAQPKAKTETPPQAAPAPTPNPTGAPEGASTAQTPPQATPVAKA